MSNIHTPSDHVLVKPSLDPEVRTAAANGRGVDCRGFTRAMMVLHLGAHDRTTGDETLTVKVQESSDDGSTDTYADVTGATTGAIGAVTPDATSGVTYEIDIDLTKRERYLRAVGTPAGTTPSDAYGVVFYLFNPVNAEVTQDNTPVSV